MKYNLVIFGVKDISKEFIKYVHEHICNVDLVVTIDQEITKEGVVSGFSPMDELESQYGIKLYKTKDYTLRDEISAKFFEENQFDIGISMNWSKLIPETILNCFTIGVFGLHGSCGYLPFGQGRATLNWSLINNERRFIMHMFKLDKFADAPNIYAKIPFEINEYDNIRTLQYKDYMASKILVSQLLDDYKDGKPIIPTLQDKDPQKSYRGRKPEEGRINLLENTRKIYSLVRAVSHPFPGAYLYKGEDKIMVWRVQPFDGIMDFSDYKLGEVIEVMDGNPIVRTVDGSMLILEYEPVNVINVGDLLR